MIRALPKQRNLVIVQNDARSQQFQGICWFGTDRYPKVVVVKGQQGDKPIAVNGYDVLGHTPSADGMYAAYGDKRLFRYTIDAVDTNNRLFFYSLFPLGAEGLLARWLVRKGGDMVSHEGVLLMAKYIQKYQSVLDGWCIIESDLFQKENFGYEVFSEPTPSALKQILKSASK